MDWESELVLEYLGQRWENPVTRLVDLLVQKTGSTLGLVGRVRGTELISTEATYLCSTKDPLISKVIRTKTGIISEVTLPFGTFSSGLIAPIDSNFLLLLLGGKYPSIPTRILSLLSLIVRPKEEEKGLSSRDLFLANMSHEIRTPLNGVIGYIQLLLQTSVSESQRKYLQAVNKCSLNLAQIINDILDFSKLVAGKMKLTPVPCQLSEIIQYVRDTLAVKLEGKQFRVRIGDDLPAYLILDRQKLIQVLMNLVSNAIKFTKPNGVIIVTCRNEKGKLWVSVKDNGIGISREDQTRLFRSFTQLDNQLTREYDGSGLGLAICKKLVELMRGKISLTSNVGEGSDFFFTVEYDSLEAALEKIKTARPEIFRAKSLLLIGDVKVLPLILGWGFKVTLASNVEEAISILSEFNSDFDLVLSGVSDPLELEEIVPAMPLIGAGGGYPLPDLDNPLEVYQCLEKALAESRYIKKKDSLRVRKDIRIAIAEDNPSNRDLLVSMLSCLGYNNVVTTSDGSELVQALQRDGKVDLILLDLKMPVMDGYEVLEYLRKNNLRIPVVIVTASVLEEYQARTQGYGIRAFLRKPILLAELKKALLMG